MFRRVVGTAVALTCVALLSSCSLLPPLPPASVNDDTGKLADAVMGHIADAVKDHDAEALEKLFSPAARGGATDLDGELTYFLSFFRSGKMMWTLDSFASGGYNAYPKETEAVYAYYRVSADGRKYELYFADFPVNSAVDPDNVGIYALGITPYDANRFTASGAPKPFYAWSGSFDNGNYEDPGTPGVYVPQK